VRERPSRYRITVNVPEPFLPDTYCTLDAALVDVVERSKHVGDVGVKVYLYDTAASPHVVRCYAIAGRVWWMRDCPSCKGSGKGNAHVHSGPIPPAGTPVATTGACAKCSGTGRMVADG